MTDNTIPEISVVMAVKNEQKHISEALDSILKQQGVFFELIVVDDNSTDNTKILLQRYSQESILIKVFSNVKNGKVSAFNMGVSLASGKYICLFAGDDVMPDGSLAKRLEVARTLPSNVPSAALFKIRIKYPGNQIDGLVVPRKKGRGNPSGASPLFNKKAISLLFPIPEVLPNEDKWFYIAFSCANLITLKHSDVVSCDWRVHSGNSVPWDGGFNDYRQAMIKRAQAYDLFIRVYEGRLEPQDIVNLKNLARAWDSYEKKQTLKILESPIGFVDKIRLLSSMNRGIYGLRKIFRRFFSGW